MSSEDCMKKIIFALIATALLSTAFGAQEKTWSAVRSITSVENSGISLDWSESGTVALQLISPNGTIVRSFSRMSITAGTSSIIDLNNLASGMYIVTVNNGRTTQSITFAK